MPRLDESVRSRSVIQVLKIKSSMCSPVKNSKLARAIERFENATVTVNCVISSVYPTDEVVDSGSHSDFGTDVGSFDYLHCMLRELWSWEWVSRPPSPRGICQCAHPWWSNVSNSGKRVTTIGKIRRTRVMIDSSNGLEPAKISEWQSQEYTYYTVMRHWHQCIRVTLKCLFLSPALGIASHWVHLKSTTRSRDSRSTAAMGRSEQARAPAVFGSLA